MIPYNGTMKIYDGVVQFNDGVVDFYQSVVVLQRSDIPTTDQTQCFSVGVALKNGPEAHTLCHGQMQKGKRVLRICAARAPKPKGQKGVQVKLYVQKGMRV